MVIRPWWLWGLGAIGIAIVALLAVIAYALVTGDGDGPSTDVARITETATVSPTATAIPLATPSPTPAPPTPSLANPVEPCEMEEVVVRGLGAACVWEFDAQGCFTLAWADDVIEAQCPDRSTPPWSTERCDEAIKRLRFMEESCPEPAEGEMFSPGCGMILALRLLISSHCFE